MHQVDLLGRIITPKSVAPEAAKIKKLLFKSTLRCNRVWLLALGKYITNHSLHRQKQIGKKFFSKKHNSTSANECM